MRPHRSAQARRVALVAALFYLPGCHSTLSTLASNGVPSFKGTTSVATVTGSSSTYGVDFGQVAVGMQLEADLSLTNVGTSPLQIRSVDVPSDPQFSVSFPPTTVIEAGSSATFPCFFKPFNAGPKTAIVLVHTDSQSVPTVTLNLRGVGVAVRLLIEPQILDFGTVVIHGTLTKPITITNQSALDLNVSQSAIKGNNAAIFVYDPDSAIADSFALKAGESKSLDFAYEPVIPSTSDSAFVTFAPSIGPQVIVTLKGIAAESGLLVLPDPMDFNFVPSGSVSTLALRIKNIGNQNVDINQVSVLNPAGGVFAIPSGTSTTATPLTPGGELDVRVQFSPHGNELYSGEIAVLSSDNLAQVSVPLVGFGGGAAISCAPTVLDFGLVAAGIGASQPVLCTNTGTDVPYHPEAGLTIGQLPPSNAAFSATVDPASPSMPLMAGQTAILDVAYVPTGAEEDHGTLTVLSNVTNPPAPPVLHLGGQAMVLGKCVYSFTPAALDWGEVLGTDKSLRYTQAFTIQNLGPNPCLVDSLHVSQSNGAAFALPDGPVVSQLLAAPGSPQFTDGGALPTAISIPVSFGPTQGRGNYAGEVVFTISDPTAPLQTVSLTAFAGDSCFFLRPDPLNLGTSGLTSTGQFCQKNRGQFVGVNNCAGDVTITGVSFGAGTPFEPIGSPSLPLLIMAGNTSPPFVIGFAPTSSGDFYSAVKVQTDLQATPFGLTLFGKAVAGTEQADTFHGSSKPAVDILWVVDSDDLSAELNFVTPDPLDKISEFVNAAQDVDYQMAVLSDDCPQQDNGSFEPCPTCYTTGTSATIITPADADPAGTLTGLIKAMSQQIAVAGYCEGIYNATMLAAWTALQPNLLSGHNAGFLRDGATLAVIVYDPDGYAEDEGSPQGTGNYLNFFRSLKGGNEQLVSISLMYLNAYGSFLLGTRYTALANASGGLLLDSAAADWTKQVAQLWGGLSAATGGFVLSGAPNPDTIQVWYDGPPPGPGVTAPGVQIPQHNQSGSTNWQYLPTYNSVLVNSKNVSLGASDTITVVYSLTCG